MGSNAKIVTLLLLFNFSWAFDTISPSKLITKLRDNGFPITQTVVTSMGYSVYLETNLNVPQGSVLGPLLFCIYINDLKQHLHVEGLRYILYAGDLQIYLQVPADQVVEGIERISLAAREVAEWA